MFLISFLFASDILLNKKPLENIFFLWKGLYIKIQTPPWKGAVHLWPCVISDLWI